MNNSQANSIERKLSLMNIPGLDDAAIKAIAKMIVEALKMYEKSN